MTEGIYGARVIGEQQFAKESETIRTSAHIYGDRVVARPAEPAEEPFLEGEPREPEPPPSPVQTPTFLDEIEHGMDGKLERIRTLITLDQLYQDEMEGANRSNVLDAIELRRQAVQTEGALSVDALRAALLEAPEFLDEAILREFNRPQLRKGALRLFLEIETGRDGGPRADVLERIEKALD